MSIVESKERFLDFRVSGRFGKAWEYGQKVYGQGHYGEEEIEWDKNEYGFTIYGLTEYGSDDKRWGIYQKRHSHRNTGSIPTKYYGPIKYIRQKFYIPKQTITEAKTNNWNKFKSGMEAWQGLTKPEKMAYNKLGNKLHLHGVNLFLRNWLNSN